MDGCIYLIDDIAVDIFVNAGTNLIDATARKDRIEINSVVDALYIVK
jgi:hypothetical protein